VVSGRLKLKRPMKSANPLRTYAESVEKTSSTLCRKKKKVDQSSTNEQELQLTESEVKFREAQRERESRLIEKRAKQSYKERVEVILWLRRQTDLIGVQSEACKAKRPP